VLRALEITYPDSVELDLQELAEFRIFMQRMMERRVVGSLRYGRPDSRQKYLTRLKKELKAYEQHGNYEQLVNIANYAALEAMAPQHLKFHFDPTVLSVTRVEE
jgi:hypothetical protein